MPTAIAAGTCKLIRTWYHATAMPVDGCGYQQPRKGGRRFDRHAARRSHLELTTTIDLP